MGIMIGDGFCSTSIYIEEGKNTLDINKEKYFSNFLSGISLRPSENNVKILSEFLEYVVEELRERGELKSLDGRDISFTFTKK
ncbi:hypothetical protein QLL95_gp0982 [Cotonvirus japonicus]|uniref:Uncharacterized protein n=1 Tax=Cotonvirus japonicus TaxID=2811091 RepID=A0ABM7NSQ4_9VIRU|nr:hypothetical protein QLL95_gp0982 [Cotonvirus japonicus]BCS83141.1 hypothetical protein [Cotonvirus japonicus]